MSLDRGLGCLEVREDGLVEVWDMFWFRVFWLHSLRGEVFIESSFLHPMSISMLE